MIIRGKDKGETGLIKRVIRSQNRVIVEGKNLVSKWLPIRVELPPVQLWCLGTFRHTCDNASNWTSASDWFVTFFFPFVWVLYTKWIYLKSFLEFHLESLGRGLKYCVLVMTLCNGLYPYQFNRSKTNFKLMLDVLWICEVFSTTIFHSISVNNLLMFKDSRMSISEKRLVILFISSTCVIYRCCCLDECYFMVPLVCLWVLFFCYDSSYNYLWILSFHGSSSCTWYECVSSILCHSLFCFMQVKKHIKQGQGHEGGIFTVEAPLHVSNVQVVDPATGSGYYPWLLIVLPLTGAVTNIIPLQEAL